MNPKPARKSAPQTDGLQIAGIILVAAVVFLSPLVAGKLTTLPALSMQVVVFAAATLWMIRAARQRSLALPAMRVVWLAAALFALGVLSLVRTVSLHATLLELAAVASYLLIFLMVAGLNSSPTRVYGILAALLVSGVIVGTIGLKEYLLTSSPEWRVFSTFFNPDFLAGFMGLILPVALAWYLSRTSGVISIVTGLAVLLSFANLLMSGSRLGMVVALGGIAVFGILALGSGSFKRAQAVRLALIILPCILAFLWLGKPLASRVASVKAESYSGRFRIYTWIGTLRMARAHPIFGTGLGTFAIAYPKHAIVGWTKLAHNSYLQYAAEGGFAMPVVLVLLLGVSAVPPAASLLRGRIAHFPNEADADRDVQWVPNRPVLLSGLLGGAAASMARNLVDSDWSVAAIGVSFWVVLGATVALASSGARRTISLSRRGSCAAAVVLSLLIVCVLSAIVSLTYSAEGSAHIAQGELNGAVRAFRRAIFYDWLNADHHRGLAATYVLLGRASGEQWYSRQAERCLLRAAKLEPTSRKTRYQLGMLYTLELSDYERAVQEFQASLACDPHSMRTLLNLAWTYERMDRKAEALAVYRRMVRIEQSPYEGIRAVPELVEPTYVFAHRALGREAERRGDRAGAVREYRIALDRIQRYEKSMEKMGPMLGSVGRRDFEMEDEVKVLKGDIEDRLEVLGADGSASKH